MARRKDDDDEPKKRAEARSKRESGDGNEDVRCRDNEWKPNAGRWGNNRTAGKEGPNGTVHTAGEQGRGKDGKVRKGTLTAHPISKSTPGQDQRWRYTAPAAAMLEAISGDANGSPSSASCTRSRMGYDVDEERAAASSGESIELTSPSRSSAAVAKLAAMSTSSCPFSSLLFLVAVLGVGVLRGHTANGIVRGVDDEEDKGSNSAIRHVKRKSGFRKVRADDAAHKSANTVGAPLYGRRDPLLEHRQASC
ncbi:hypothetical protein AURDEDRAFT_122298 [Auricularia subglabra TFB-10046 SS5]|nr:hypothetical protein AURDEDRAFT_122298 [Auricularia subglabra TFB-10046 SS5]